MIVLLAMNNGVFVFLKIHCTRERVSLSAIYRFQFPQRNKLRRLLLFAYINVQIRSIAYCKIFVENQSVCSIFLVDFSFSVHIVSIRTLHKISGIFKTEFSGAISIRSSVEVFSLIQETKKNDDNSSIINVFIALFLFSGSALHIYAFDSAHCACWNICIFPEFHPYFYSS